MAKLLTELNNQDNPMPSETEKQCTDQSQNLTIELPCQIVERVERYARDNGSTVAGILIEALDHFLRKQGYKA